MINISDFSSVCRIKTFSFASCPETMSKRVEDGEKGETYGEVKADDEFGFEDYGEFFNSAKFEYIR